SLACKTRTETWCRTSAQSLPRKESIFTDFSRKTSRSSSKCSAGIAQIGSCSGACRKRASRKMGVCTKRLYNDLSILRRLLCGHDSTQLLALQTHDTLFKTAAAQPVWKRPQTTCACE